MAFNQDRLQRIGSFLQSSYLDRQRLPGSLVRILHQGRNIYTDIRGYADVGHARPLTEDSIFRIYSMTKPITSIALMQLVEEGRLQIDDPVHRYIPNWKNLRVYEGGSLGGGWRTTEPKRPMLVIDLLRHTSGLTYGFQNSSNVDAAYRQLGIGVIEANDMTLPRMIELLAELPLEFSPGDAWCYSLASDVVGWLIEVIANEPLDSYLARRIFRPLGMHDTGFQVKAGQEARLTSCYRPVPEGGIEVQDPAETSPFLRAPSMLSGGGGLVSTAADYLKFCEALRSGYPKLIGRKTLALMTANHLPGGVDLPQISRAAFSESIYAGAGFGLGFSTTTDIHKTLLAGSNGDYFWGGVASTSFWIDPAEELTVLFLTQLMPSSTWPIRRQLRSMVYAALD